MRNRLDLQGNIRKPQKIESILSKTLRIDSFFTKSRRRLAEQDVSRNSFYTWQMSYY